MRKSSQFSGLWFFAPLLIVGGLSLFTPVQADPAIPISECREQSIDQSGFGECLTLLAQESESALSQMEANWLDEISVSQWSGKQVGDEPDQIQAQDVSATGSVQNTDEASDQVIAIVNEEALADGGAPLNSRLIYIDDATPADASAAEGANNIDELQVKQFTELLPLFRRFRDQRCEWEAGLLGPDRAMRYQLACKIALNRQQTIQLRRLLVEKSASDASGESYRGYYVRTASGGSFQSCDRRQDWWVTGSEVVLEALQRRYSDIAAENLEMVYVELRGHAGKSVVDGPGADFVGAIEVATVNLMRPILEQDCRARQAGLAVSPVAENPTEDEFSEADDITDVPETKPPEVTVDDLGDAGFLYGYFSSWMSACAVDKLAVCQAQTQAEYASEGEWMLSVDRSSRSDWRLRLIPTTENHLISGPLGLTIDGVENFTANISESEIELGRGVRVANGQRARTMISRLRAGQSLEFDWIRPDQVSARVSFSLQGVTRALEYFNQAEK